MGTETYYTVIIITPIIWVIVKLNNPQMGTETVFQHTTDYTPVGTVKLNNPQMGTETWSLWHKPMQLTAS